MSNDIQRFLAKIFVNATGCWEWSGFRLPNGYGRFRLGKNMELAHRASWMLLREPIPPGKFICHTCDNKPCVNPDHLFVGTHSDNMKDMVRKGRGSAGEKSHLSKLRTEQVIAIRQSVGNRDIIAAQYGVSGSLVSYIRRGDIWKALHVK